MSSQLAAAHLTEEVVLKTTNSAGKTTRSQERLEKVRTVLLALTVLMKVPDFIAKSLELFTLFLGG